MDRRGFIIASAAAAALGGRARAAAAEDAPVFTTGDARWQAAYDKALAVLAGNVQVLPYISRPVLIEGSVYRGIWMECGPHEALIYRKFRPDLARDSHLTFFELQRADGQLPANNKVTETSFGQIQMVVPIAATAWELARATGDDELLERAYAACGAWDAWLRRWRDTRGTGLVEGFCTYDTGHDNSPRWAGMPDQCPNKDARRHHDIATLPRLCPDFSATMVGARRAMAAMARALGKSGDRWEEDAETLRRAILARLYSAEDAAFYDEDALGKPVKVRSDILSRVCGEHVPDQPLFDGLWERQIHKPEAFWPAYPLPSIALDDPAFVRPIPRNSWGGASQALTALRAGRWMEHYGRAAEFAVMMQAWCEAIQRDPSFRQQIDPVSGAFTQEDEAGYSPCALVMVDYSWRLAGVREEGELLHWNVRPGLAVSKDALFAVKLDGGARAEMRYDARGAELSLADKRIARVEGLARLVTDAGGTPHELVGIGEAPQRVTLRIAGRPATHHSLTANQRIAIR